MRLTRLSTRKSPALLCGAVLLGGMSLLAAHQPADQQAPAFRAGTTLVEVSAIVTRDGRPVTDIRADEVRVLDEGVEQPLIAFEYVDLTTVDGPAQRRDFVLVIDNWHIDPRRTKSMQLVPAQLVEALGAHDRLAIVTTGPQEFVQQLSTDREASRHLLRRIRGQNGPAFGSMLATKARIALEVVRQVVEVLGTDSAERRAIVIVSEGHPGVGEASHAAEPPELQQVREEYRRVLAAAARANVAIYGIDPRGLTAGFPRIGTGGNRDAVAVASGAAQASADAMIGRYYGSLGLLALNTGGGLTVDTNDLGKRIPEMLRDSRQYYRVAYVQPDPTPGKPHPSTRRIEVKMERSDVVVRARQRYAPG